MRTKQLVTCLLILTLGVTGVAKAGMISTDQAYTSQQAQTERERLNIILQRKDVVTELNVLGVNPTEAQTRVSSLTDQEVLNLSSKIDQLPVGGDFVGDVLGFGLFVFLVLLITDILGLTDVFPFVHHPAH